MSRIETKCQIEIYTNKTQACWVLWLFLSFSGFIYRAISPNFSIDYLGQGSCPRSLMLHGPGFRGAHCRNECLVAAKCWGKSSHSATCRTWNPTETGGRTRIPCVSSIDNAYHHISRQWEATYKLISIIIEQSRMSLYQRNNTSISNHFRTSYCFPY